VTNARIRVSTFNALFRSARLGAARFAVVGELDIELLVARSRLPSAAVLTVAEMLQ
jgi:hypothetical protein